MEKNIVIYFVFWVHQYDIRSLYDERFKLLYKSKYDDRHYTLFDKMGE